MRSKRIAIILCLLMVTAVFTAVVPGIISAKPTKSKDTEEKKPISIDVIWKDDGYYFTVTGPKGLNVYLVIIDHKGERTHSEMKYDNGEYSVWISKKIAKNRNDIYIAIMDASDNLSPNDKGAVQALYFQVINIDIKGKKDWVRLKTTTVLESKLLLETVFDDKGTTGDNKELEIRNIARHGVRKGAGPGSFLDLTHTIEFQIPTPDFNLDSFFDVFYGIDLHPPETGYEFDTFFDITYRIKSYDFTIDSFFDVFFERSNKGTDFHVDSYIDVDEDDELEPIIPESFFDISIKTDFGLPYPGRLGGDFIADSFFDVSYEIDFSGNVNRRDNKMRMRGGMESSLSGGAYYVGKNTPLGMGSTRFKISDDKLGPVSVLNKARGAVVEKESLFDVFTELTLGLGPQEKGGDDNYVDSFFDVFTELSFHPGRTWIGPDGGMKLNSFFDVFTKLSIDDKDWDLVAIDDNKWDITAEDDWESPNVLTSSFFDVFTSYEPEMFAETLPDDYFIYHINSFFDVFFELINTVPAEETSELQLDDTEPPEVIFTTPVRGSYVTGTAAALRGTATDLGGGIETIKIDSFNDGYLELEGSVEGSINENYGVSFDGSIELKNDFEKQFGESVSVGLASGGGLNVKVEKNSFKGAELTDVVITASITVSDVEFELEGRVNGSINENYEVSFEGSIELKNDVEKEFGTSADASILAGTRLEINDSVNYYSEKTTFKGEVTYIEIPLKEEDKPRVLIRAYDKLHRLTRGRNSRTWSDREESETNGYTSTIMESRSDCFAETLPDDLKYHCIYSIQNPESSTGSFFDAFLKSGLDINFPSVATGPISPPPENFISIDSFFDVFTKIDSSVDGLYHIDSFFDVFVEIDNGQMPGGLYHIDSFFDVFTEIDLNDEVEFICAWNETLHILEGFSGGEFQVMSLQVYGDFAAPSRNNDTGDPDPPQIGYFDLEYLSETLDGIIQQMAMLQTFNYSGIEMQKNNTTIAGDKYGTETLHIQNYGTINLSLKYDPKADASGDPPAMTVSGFELYHRLTRGTSSRTWDDGTTCVFQEVIWTTSTVTSLGDEENEDATLIATNSSLRVCSQTPDFTDSFFDVLVEIVLEDDGQYHIDSFLDTSYEMDDDRERECPECGSSVGSDAETCPDCGEELPENDDDLTDSFFDVFVEIESKKVQDEDKASKGLSGLNLESKTAIGEDEFYFLVDDIRFPSGDLGDYWEFDSGGMRSSIGITERGFWYSSAVMIPHQPLPEQDDEVLVMFEHGDSNHPYDINLNSLGKDLWVYFTPFNRSLFAEVHHSVVQISNRTGNYTLIHVFVEVYANETDESGNVEKVLLYSDLFRLNHSLIDVDSHSGSSSVREVMELVVDHAEYK